MKEKEMQFSSKAEKELGIFLDAVKEILNLSIDAFETNNTDEAARVEPLRRVIDDINTVVKAKPYPQTPEGKMHDRAGICAFRYFHESGACFRPLFQHRGQRH